MIKNVNLNNVIMLSGAIIKEKNNMALRKNNMESELV